MKREKIYIVGHINPDLDAIASAYGYEQYRHSLKEYEYRAIRCGEINSVTRWVFDRYKTPIPPFFPSISNLNVVLVDHTYPENRPKGWENANIVEVIDHHDVKLVENIPKRLTIRPCGSTSTLIVEKMVNSNISIPFNTAGILLSAILDDTLGLMSPTTVQLDIKMVNILSNIIGISNVQEYFKLLFKQKDVWSKYTAKEIIEEDVKSIEIDGNWVSVSQVETLNNREFNEREIIEELEVNNSIKPYSLRIVMLTDLNKRDCLLLVVGKDIPLVEKALNKEIKDNRVYLKGVVSRKKQILPILENIYS